MYSSPQHERFPKGLKASLTIFSTVSLQIKNAVRTAQSLALSEDEMFSMQHIRRVLEVGEDFNNDLKGGTGYLDAMRSYT